MRARRKNSGTAATQKIMLAEADGRVRSSRDVSALSSKTFDLVVIGGGILGSGIAWDAALRGLSVALIEKNDFGSGTSSGCFRIVHGGMRYLQHLDFSRMKKSVREQRIFRRIAPHLVRPLPVLVPCYGVGKRGRSFLKTGMSLYEALSRDRNQGVYPSLHLNRSQELSVEEVLAQVPYLSRENLRGGITFEDLQMLHAERLTGSVALAARDAGAVICNYVEATGARRDDTVRGEKKIQAVTFRDLLGGREGEVQCRMVVNAAGPWTPKVAALLSANLSSEDIDDRDSAIDLFRANLLPNGGLLSKGFQIAVPSVTPKYALAVESREKDVTSVVSRGGRSYFIVPWRGLSLIGTTDAPYRDDPDDFYVSDEEIADFVSAVSAAYPDPGIRKDEVRFAFGGLLPTESIGSRKATDDAIRVGKEDLIIDHREKRRVKQGPKKGQALPRVGNLISAAALKYTTFRALSEEVVDKVVGRLGKRYGHCRTSFTPIAGGSIGDPKEFLNAAIDDFGSRFPTEQIERLVSHYGSDMLEVFECALEHSSLLEPVAPGSMTLAAEIIYAIRYEQASTLADVVIRRTLLGAFGFPGGAALDRTVELMSAELGWDRAREESELASVMQHYRMGRAIEGRAPGRRRFA